MQTVKTLASVGALSAALLISGAAAAQDSDRERLIELMRIGDTVEVMRKEGLRYGAEIGAEMLPDIPNDDWERTVSRIYDAEKMEAVITQGFETALEGEAVGPLVDFFESELGAEIVELEISAREAFLDEETEMAAMDAFEMARGDETELYQQVETIIADSDLVEYNVMGAMNANLMFYRGLADGGAIDLGESDMLADVWAQEPDIRAESEAWLGSFLMMAYRPLDADELEAYAELYRTPEGRVLNTAVFNAYDRMYDEISYLLGQAVAEQMRSEEL
ncbi:hypothetical protein XM53_00070 [Roseovarius atlanticus]|uniref:Uncharacterized protein n=1 Tax=Roseovarius atlanticus TaxID=1641875 RepID=A0A0T5P169_9RHOB|nr:DUF2059 domain-containing protein [Roseovarius atlanticus]KRS14892.1 hypothetical protein XM53_00070 [Roseovarius atlanticus]